MVVPVTVREREARDSETRRRERLGERFNLQVRRERFTSIRNYLHRGGARARGPRPEPGPRDSEREREREKERAL